MNDASPKKPMTYLQAEDYLRGKGMKRTPDRVKVLDFLMKESRPLSADDIGAKMGKSVSTASLYRMLKTFAEKGFIYETRFRDRKAYFEFQDDHHHHLVCTSCGTREAVRECIAADYKKIIRGSKAFKAVQSHMLEFFGVCKKCARSASI